jgi:AraC family transcriptional regulator, regulatory protein of adaptative response / DNA-3-methyladenine glycosylase II
VSTNFYGQPLHGALDPAVLSRACDARDSRFDGLFFVGITTTRIYCRPVCPARVSCPERRRFFSSAAAAEQAGFRPCLRCRPELAPGRAEMDIVSRLAARAAKRVAAGALNGHSVAELACELGVSERHLRRAFERELGVSPVQLALTHRLLLAKRLLADTSLSVTRIAYASGFQSLRRFNAVFCEHYRMPPSALRQSRRARSTSGIGGRPDLLRLTLAYRAPLAWDALADCLARDAIPGVDFVEGGQYGRTVELDGRRGAIFVQDSVAAGNGATADGAQERAPGSAHLDVDISLSLVPVLMPLLARLRHLFDLDAEPTVIDSHLAAEGLRAFVMRRPGVRIPGAFSGFEAAFRTLLGGWPRSDLEVNELAQRVVEALGEPSDITEPRLGWHLPTAERVVNAGADRLQELGVPHSSAMALAAIAREVMSGRLSLHAGGDPIETRCALLAIDGVSEQMATMIIMRALSWPDAFPIAKSESASESLLSCAEKWRPWRAYALLHLWMDKDLSSGSRRYSPNGYTPFANSAAWYPFTPIVRASSLR